MGAHSTINITRERAQQYVMSKLLTMTDDELGRMMDTLLYDRLYNCWITHDENENDDDLL